MDEQSSGTSTNGADTNNTATRGNSSCCGFQACGIDSAKIIARAKEVVSCPETVWPKLKEEPLSIKDVYSQYLLGAAAVPPLARFLGGFFESAGPSFFSRIGLELSRYLISLIFVYVGAVIIQKLSPYFNGKSDLNSSFKLLAYSLLPVYLIGILYLIPSWSFRLLTVILSLYGLFLYYHGVPTMTGVPQERRTGFAVISILALLCVFLLLGVVITLFTPEPFTDLSIPANRA